MKGWLAAGGLGCAGLLALPLLGAALAAALAATLLPALLVPRGEARPGAAPAPVAGTGRPTIRDLGFGPSDAARIDAFVAALQPRSPLRGFGAQIVALAREFGVDPLLIVVWQVESQMDTVGLNVPGNGGNMIWDAMAPYAARWSCAPGPSSLGHHWGACPSITAGLGIWFEYVGTSPVYAGAADLAAFADVYNPCSDPANAANGFPCGAAYADLLLGLLRTYAGPPAVSAGGGPGFQAIWGGGDEPITQEFGRTGFSDGNPIYGYGAAYGLPAGVHPGVDVGLPAGTPLYSPVDGVIVIAGGSGYYRDEDEAVDPATSGELRIRRPNGDLIILGHLRRIDVRVGQAVRTGQPVGLSGSANGPHVHVEVRVVDASLPSGYRIVNPRPYLDGAGR